MSLLSALRSLFRKPIEDIVPDVVVPARNHIMERHVGRPCPERQRFNEKLYSTGFVSSDGILRVFYADGLAVEIEVNGMPIDLRSATPFPQHPRWRLSRDLIHAWMREHDVEITSDYSWVVNRWDFDPPF